MSRYLSCRVAARTPTHCTAHVDRLEAKATALKVLDGKSNRRYNLVRRGLRRWDTRHPTHPVGAQVVEDRGLATVVETHDKDPHQALSSTKEAQDRVENAHDETHQDDRVSRHVRTA
jgi:hypothetical protein